jgi:hypothetical protein
MKRAVLGVLVLAVCGMMVAPVGMAGKPQPPPTPTEPTGNIILSGNTQLVLAPLNGYIRLYDWNKGTGQYIHQWSASGMGACILGDVDNDGSKELVGSKYTVEVIGGIEIKKAYLRIWENGNPSDSPAYSQLLSNRDRPAHFMKLGDVDGDGLKELVIETYDLNMKSIVEIWEFGHKDLSGNVIIPTGPSKVIYDNGGSIGYGLELGDVDNDNIDEIIVSCDHSSNPMDMAVIIDYSSGAFNIVGYIGAPVVDCAAVVDLQNAGRIAVTCGNDGKIYAYKYINGVYTEVWNTAYDRTYNGVTSSTGFLQSNDAADIDNDGDQEIIAGSQLLFAKGKSYHAPIYRLYFWDYQGIDPNTGRQIWIEYHNDIDNVVSQGDNMAHGKPDGSGSGDYVIYDGVLFKYAKDISGNPYLKVVQSIPFGRSVSIG